MPEFTADWFAPIIPVWETHVVPQVAHLNPLRVLELGTHEGRSVLWMAERFKAQQVTISCVDFWYDVPPYERFKRNIAGYDNIIPHRKHAVDYLMTLRADEMFDVIYIDTEHVAQETILQACLSWKHLNMSGLLIFDDYPWDKLPEPARAYPTKRGVDAFLSCFEPEYQLIHKDWQVIVKKIEPRLISEVEQTRNAPQ